MIDDRPYQDRMIAEVRNAYQSGIRRVLVWSPTGSGKSTITAKILGRTKKSVLILAPQRELVRQLRETVKDVQARVDVMTMQSAVKNLHDLPKYEWILSDEAHLTVCETWSTILDHFRNAWHLGLSATPCRLDGQGLGVHYDKIIMGPTVKELVGLGFLVPCVTYRAPEPDATKIVDNMVRFYRKHADGKLGAVFVSTIAQAEITAEQYRAAGINALHITGNLSPKEIDRRFAAIRSGTARVLVCVNLATTGVDIPEIEIIQDGHRTDSLSGYLQKVGRGFRIAPWIGKTHCIYGDHVGNSHEHGLPEMAREWRLDGTAKKINPATAFRTCSACFAVYEPAPFCPQCGAQVEVKDRAIKGVIDEDLQLADDTRPMLPPLKQHIAIAMHEAHATCDDRRVADRRAYTMVAKARGYSSGWVYQQLKIRQFKMGGRP
jgi:DNA repair protein RadD